MQVGIGIHVLTADEVSVSFRLPIYLNLKYFLCTSLIRDAFVRKTISVPYWYYFQPFLTTPSPLSLIEAIMKNP